MTIQTILDTFAYHDGNFPRAALEEAATRRQEIIEPLLEILERAARAGEELEPKATYMAHIYAIFLLAGFREKRAFSKILELFREPVELSEELTREVVSEWLGRIFAAVGHGETAPLQALAANREVDVDVRSGALRGMVAMVAREEASREDVMQIFRGFFQGGLERRASHLWDVLVGCSTDLCPLEVFEEIERAYDEELVDAFFVEPQEVDQALGLGRIGALARLKEKKEYRPIDDVIAEMEWWACFQQAEQDG